MKTTIHLSMPDGSEPPELHLKVAPEVVAFLAAMAEAAGVPITTAAANVLAAAAAAAKAGQPDLKIDLQYWQPDAETIDELRREVAALASRIGSARVACLNSRPPSDKNLAAERETRLADLAAALAATLTTLGKLEKRTRLNSAGLVAEVIKNALEETKPQAAPALMQPPLPAGVTKQDLAKFLNPNTLRAATRSGSLWLACALASSVLGQEFTIPRPTPTLQRPPTTTTEGAQ